MLSSDLANLEYMNGEKSIKETIISICNKAVEKLDKGNYDSLSFDYDIERLENEYSRLTTHLLNSSHENNHTIELGKAIGRLRAISDKDFDFHGNAITEPDDWTTIIKLFESVIVEVNVAILD